jgi:hypothetical protein
MGLITQMNTLGVGEELARKYAATYGWQIAEEFYRLPNMLS